MLAHPLPARPPRLSSPLAVASSSDQADQPPGAAAAHREAEQEVVAAGPHVDRVGRPGRRPPPRRARRTGAGWSPPRTAIRRSLADRRVRRRRSRRRTGPVTVSLPTLASTPSSVCVDRRDRRSPSARRRRASAGSRSRISSLRLCSRTSMNGYGVRPAPSGAERDPAEDPVEEPGRERVRPVRRLEHQVAEAELVVDLQAAGLHDQRPRLAGRAGLAVHDDHVDAEFGQPVGEHQPGRAGAHHQHVTRQLGHGDHLAQCSCSASATFLSSSASARQTRSNSPRCRLSSGPCAPEYGSSTPVTRIGRLREELLEGGDERDRAADAHVDRGGAVPGRLEGGAGRVVGRAGRVDHAGRAVGSPASPRPGRPTARTSPGGRGPPRTPTWGRRRAPAVR